LPEVLHNLYDVVVDEKAREPSITTRIDGQFTQLAAEFILVYETGVPGETQQAVQVLTHYRNGLVVIGADDEEQPASQPRHDPCEQICEHYCEHSD
jgi:hypothetical protein